MSRDSFADFRNNRSEDPYIFHNNKLWCLHAGTDERGYVLTLQMAGAEPMVRVGCRYLTLKAARSHYVSKDRNFNANQRRTAKHMLALIGIAVATAHFKGWLPKTVKFNATPRKVR